MSEKRTVFAVISAYALISTHLGCFLEAFFISYVQIHVHDCSVWVFSSLSLVVIGFDMEVQPLVTQMQLDLSV